MIITIFGWLAVFAGIARIAFPDAMKSVGRAMIEKTAFFMVPSSLMIALGAYLSYQGYFA